jgi:hypothetical protein
LNVLLAQRPYSDCALLLVFQDDDSDIDETDVTKPSTPGINLAMQMDATAWVKVRFSLQMLLSFCKVRCVANLRTWACWLRREDNMLWAFALILEIAPHRGQELRKDSQDVQVN